MSPTSAINALAKLSAIAVLGVIGLIGVKFYQSQTAQQAKIAALETQNAHFVDVINRLGAERRMADMVVSEQVRQADGKLKTTLLMVEYDPRDRPLPPRSFTVVGERVHLDALVIKFDAADVERNDPIRGHAFLLFEKIYGDAQAPADAAPVDSPDRVPDSLSDLTTGKVAEFERDLWKKFWQLSADASLRKQYGVKVAHGVGVFEAFAPGYRYTVTLQADGNVTLYNEPLPAILNAALKRDTSR